MSRHGLAPHVCSALLALLFASSAVADTIRLRPSVRLPADTTVVRLGDIAELDGDEATRFAELPIAELEDPTSVREIPLELVRERLHDAGAHRGRLNLNGRSVVLRPRAGRGTTAPGAMAGASLVRTAPRPPAAEPAERLASSLVTAATLGGRIARDMVQALEARPDDVRLVFDHDDFPRLDLVEQGVRFEIVPGSSLRTDRVTLNVRDWIDGVGRLTFQITLRPIVRRAVLIARRDLGRGEVVAAPDIETQSRWLPPSQCTGATRPEELEGRVMTRNIRAGELVSEKHARRRTIVERGDRVIVRCLVGGVVISMKAQAREDGAAGDTIELQKLGERETFLGTVVRRGEAVVQFSRPGT